ncbi:MAG: hypothetical protein HUU38_14925, partial [Anaerolineales bacterium]|nr:hypothetical protein [Anaerolineales bacterium]
MSMIDAIPVRFAHVDDMGWCMHTLTVTSDAVMKRKIDFKEIIVAEMKENLVGVLELMYMWQGHKGCVPYISSIMVLNPYRR